MNIKTPYMYIKDLAIENIILFSKMGWNDLKHDNIANCWEDKINKK